MTDTTVSTIWSVSMASLTSREPGLALFGMRDTTMAFGLGKDEMLASWVAREGKSPWILSNHTFHGLVSLPRHRYFQPIFLMFMVMRHTTPGTTTRSTSDRVFLPIPFRCYLRTKPTKTQRASHDSTNTGEMGTEGANKTTLTVDRGNTRTVPGAANFLEALCIWSFLKVHANWDL